MSAPLDISSTGPTQAWTITMPRVGNAITGRQRIAQWKSR